MAKFFVGQRVKLIKPIQPEDIGIEGIILEHDGRPCDIGAVVEYDVMFDGEFWRSGCYGWQLEPISDSNTKISWANMADLWTPSRLSEEA